MQCEQTIFNGSKVWEITLDPLANWLNKRVLRYDCVSFTKKKALINAQTYL